MNWLFKLQVRWTPYGPIPDGHVTYYHGTIRFLNIIEPYMPERISRQFGRVQRIPGRVIEPYSCVYRKNPRSYKKACGSSDAQWDIPAAHRLNADFLGPLATHSTSSVSPDYMEWFRRVSHVRVTNPDGPNGQLPPPRPTQFAIDQRVWYRIPFSSKLQFIS